MINFIKTYTVSNLEYAKLKLSNFTVKLHDYDPSIALFDTGAPCSSISYQHFTNISNKVNIIKKALWVNTASRATLGPIGIVQLTMNIEEHSFKCNFIICMKLKQPLIIGLDFAQRYKLGVDWNTSGTLSLWLDWWKIASTMKKASIERHVMTIQEPKLTIEHERDEKMCVVTRITVALPPHHITIVP